MGCHQSPKKKILKLLIIFFVYYLCKQKNKIENLLIMENLDKKILLLVLGVSLCMINVVHFFDRMNTGAKTPNIDAIVMWIITIVGVALVYLGSKIKHNE